VTLGRRKPHIPQTTFKYLVVLCRYAPKVVDYKTLLTEVEGPTSWIDRQRALEQVKWHIHELRKALELNPRRPRHVLNVRGTGYRLVVD
jgi:two-component system, OmpR family, response regulator RegX3